MHATAIWAQATGVGDDDDDDDGVVDDHDDVVVCSVIHTIRM